MNMEVSVSFLKTRLTPQETISELNWTSCDYLHIDVMDGVFVDNETMNIDEITLLLRENIKPLDVHLMCSDLKKYIPLYADLMPKYITFHLEAVDNVDEIINYIHSYGIKCGISIKPETSVDELLPYLDKIDLVLVMSVNPGLGGQTFMMESTNKINKLRKLNKGNFKISVDGGINNETIKYVDVDIAVSGSYVCMSNDFEMAIRNLRGY